MKPKKKRSSIGHDLYANLLRQILSGQPPEGSAMPTVRALAEKYRTSVNTVQRVMARLEAEGYVKCRLGRNNVAASPASQADGRIATGSLIAILGVDNSTPEDHVAEWPCLWGQEVSSSVSATLHAEDVECFSVTLRGTDRENAPSLLEIYQSRLKHASGIIAFPSLSMNFTAEIFGNFPVPIVTINRAGFWQSANFVTADYIFVGRQLADAFGAQKLSKILLVGSLKNSQSWREICMGFLESEMESGRGLNRVQSVETSKSSESGGFEVIKSHLEENDEIPEVVIAAGDYLALGAIRALRQVGLRVPEDVQVVGGAGDDMSEFTNPPLSVVAQPTRKIGSLAGELMLRLIREKIKLLPGLVVPTRIIWRHSARLSSEAAAALVPDLKE